MISARLISYTQPVIGVSASSPEELVSYCARVSNPSNQDNYDTAEGLLKYCVRNKHWSIFEMVDATVEVYAPRDITRQMLRHRSFSFQEFSQRYSDEIDFMRREVRLQDPKNRQNSIEIDFDKEHGDLIENWYEGTEGIVEAIYAVYEKLRKEGVAKEVARVILPEGLTMSRLYMKGSLRSWMHYLEVREGNGTQKEHIQVANLIRAELLPVFPTVLGMEL